MKWLTMRKKCPKCGSRNTKKIVYGYPDEKLIKMYQQGSILIGGCCIETDDPDYRCANCQFEWRKKSPLR